MWNRNVALSCVILSVAVVFFHCTDQGPVAGTITQSGNGVVSGVVVDSGVPVSGVRVLLIPAEYDPGSDIPLPDSLVDTTNSTGEYRISASEKTRYNVEVAGVSGKMALLYDVGVMINDTQHLASLNITVPGCVLVNVYDTVSLNSAHVYIPGTTIFSPFEGTSAVLTNVPSGVVPLVRFRSFAGNVNRALSSNITVLSNDTTNVVDYALWRYSRRIYLNTTVSGAAISGDVTNFPVLVRLTSANFDFSQAKSAGEDAGFSKGSDVPLAFEITQWDSAGGTAEIWVKMDTVYGNDSSHYITMYWGNQNAISVSSPETVFDTANGFLGVWHLGESGGSKIADATFHHYNGTASETAPSSIDGVMGKGYHFNGSDNGIVMPGAGNSPLNFSRAGPYTFSAWVMVDTVYGDDSFIAGKGHDQYSLRVKGSLSIPSNMLAIHEYDDTRVATDMRCLPVVMEQWKYMTALRNGEKFYLYVDGVCVDSTGILIDGKKTVLNSTSFSIGRCAEPFNGDNYLPFRGAIDEVRISGVARSADWIKLCYMNQKVQDRLLLYK